MRCRLIRLNFLNGSVENSLMFALWPMPNCRSPKQRQRNRVTIDAVRTKQHAFLCEAHCICIWRCIKLTVENWFEWNLPWLSKQRDEMVLREFDWRNNRVASTINKSSHQNNNNLITSCVKHKSSTHTVHGDQTIRLPRHSSHFPFTFTGGFNPFVFTFWHCAFVRRLLRQLTDSLPFIDNHF